ncbi:hypothetical protein WR25_05875 [Diploscapter pachys]|uniref:Phosphodiesterase n=1 Tax=Diploscapter pachys TaxID=2018661 RepID=A0A2A2L905_9BILA|nr:hypothetical protein WR25_05875 [Diploscapter pachys]
MSRSLGDHSDLLLTNLFKRKFSSVFGVNDRNAARCMSTCLDSDPSVSIKPKVANITFSTVTSATGLPTIAAEPNKPRSSSHRKQDVQSAGNSNERSKADIVDVELASTVGGQRNCVQRVESLPSGAVLRVTTSDGAVFDVAQLQTDRNFRYISGWSLPIFELSARYPTSLLSRLSYTIFHNTDLFRIFKISPVKFFNFFHSLESGYWDIPYHNSVHASDVLHACYYLTVHPVSLAFGAATSPDSPLPPPLPTALPLSHHFSNLELMALFTAAAMHDYDHPGRTNAFLVAVEDKKAILYNDRSVLENHHAAASWKLLSQQNNHFIENLDAAELKRFRYLVLEYILATDLKQHFEIIVSFTEKTNEMEMNNESDRLLVAKLIIKMADINSPTKPYDLHRKWTERICEEFYEQGDEEVKRGMPITCYMDRNDPGVAKLQDSFICHVVSPMATAMREAGLLPILPGLEEPEMIINLRHNHTKWLYELEQLEGQQNSSGHGSDRSGLNNGVIEEEEESNKTESSLDTLQSDVQKCRTKDDEYI